MHHVYGFEENRVAMVLIHLEVDACVPNVLYNAVAIIMKYLEVWPWELVPDGIIIYTHGWVAQLVNNGVLKPSSLRRVWIQA